MMACVIAFSVRSFNAIAHR